MAITFSVERRTESAPNQVLREASESGTKMALNYLHLAQRQLKNPADREFAVYLDSLYPTFRQDFLIPTNEGVGASEHPQPHKECIYFCGNSLGLQPKLTRTLVTAELDVWASRGVQGHLRHDKWPWVSIHETCTAMTAKIVGAQEDEIAIMGSLTANLHLLMAAFYAPTPQRHKIIIESKAFPSDHYATESQIRWHGYDPRTSLVQITPLPGQSALSTDQILTVISEHAASTALFLLPGVQFYTGQAFDIPKITEFAHSKGIVVGWDLAHAAGNLDLRLHDWNVDFAAWCSYKYLNAGPGGIAGLFVHSSIKESKKLTGWWGHEEASRFNMTNDFVPILGAGGYQLSNPSVLDMMALRASLETFNKTNITALREKSIALTGYLEYVLQPLVDQGHFTIITPRDPNERGAQLSLYFDQGVMEEVYDKLIQRGIICDDRKPSVIRVSPAPLYNTFEEVWEFVIVLREVLAEVKSEK